MLALHLRIVGVLMFALVLVNLGVPRRFGWKQQFQQVPLLARQVFFVHYLFIVLLLAMFGVQCLFFTDTLIEPTRLARVMLAGLTIFWAVRLFAQWFIYDAKLWRGDRFNTAMHYLFTVIWAYFVGVYSWALWCQWQTA